MRREFLCDRLGKELDTPFRRRVVRVPGPGDFLMHGAHENHLARRERNRLVDAAAQKLARRLALSEELPREVDVDDGVPLLEGHLGERRVALQPGVAHRDVQGAEVVDRLGKHRDDLVFFAHIGLDRDGASPEPFDRMGDLFRRFRLGHIVHHDVGTGLRETERHGLADARVGAGNERRLAFEQLRKCNSRLRTRTRRRGRSGVFGRVRHEGFLSGVEVEMSCTEPTPARVVLISDRSCSRSATSPVQPV